MKAVLARAYGGPEVLTLEDLERPAPQADQVLVEVHAAATNPSYWHRMEGKIPVLRQAYGDPEPTDPALGAAVQAMTDAATGSAPSMQHLLVIVFSAAAFGLAATRLFRWE